MSKKSSTSGDSTTSNTSTKPSYAELLASQGWSSQDMVGVAASPVATEKIIERMRDEYAKRREEAKNAANLVKRRDVPGDEPETTGGNRNDDTPKPNNPGERHQGNQAQRQEVPTEGFSYSRRDREIRSAIAKSGSGRKAPDFKI